MILYKEEHQNWRSEGNMSSWKCHKDHAEVLVYTASENHVWVMALLQQRSVIIKGQLDVLVWADTQGHTDA